MYARYTIKKFFLIPHQINSTNISHLRAKNSISFSYNQRINISQICQMKTAKYIQNGTPTKNAYLHDSIKYLIKPR